MIRPWLNWRTALAVIAILFVSGSIFYSEYLSKKIAGAEKEKVEIWAAAQKAIINANDQTNLNLAIKISSENTDIPIIGTNENDSITNDYLNLDSSEIKSDSGYLRKKLAEFKKEHAPIIIVLTVQPYSANKYYYGESLLQQEVRYFPIIQLFIAALFIFITIFAQRSGYRSTQNQLWAGMAKETAHQLGTPVSSLQGWIEMLKDIPGNEKITPEIEKDVNRLLLITDRFGKIGSMPHLEEKNLVEQMQSMVDYIKKRAGAKINFVIDSEGKQNITAKISPPLFDWVIENLLKNALDAMEGKGMIKLLIHQTSTHVLIDISDTGKGIAAANLGKVFKPGFTTKKRGWGLGLTLTKRIVEQYHKGKIFVKHSELNKGTTFRIELNK
jgi:signal transduction histidine kinase